MTDMTAWQQFGVIAALGAGSWGLRAGFIVLPAGRGAAAFMERWLTHARPAILAALLASVLSRTATADPAGASMATWLPLIAGVAAGMLAARRWGLSGSLAAGLVAYVLAGLAV